MRRFFRGVLAVVWIGAASAAAAADPEALRLREIRFEGASSISTDTLRSFTALQPEQSITPEQIQYARGVLASRFREQGHWEVRVSTGLDPLEDGRSDLIFFISEGPVYTIGSIHVEGQRELSGRVIRRELAIDEGAPFSETAVFEGHKRLFLTGYFDAIDIDYSTATANRVDVLLKVHERPTKYVKGSGGYGAESKERLSAGYEDRNFLGNLRRLDASVTHSGFISNPQKFQTTRLEVSLAQPYFLNTVLEAQTRVTREWKRRESYDSAATEWQTTLVRKLGTDLSARARYRYSGTRVFRLSPDVTETPSFTNISALGPGFTYDNTGDLIMPRFGWRVTSLYEKGLTIGVGDINFHRFEARAGRFETFWNQMTVFLGFQFGLMRPDNPDGFIPIFERFTLGGANTVRGYGERDLGPADSQGDPVGGESLAVMNLELRRRIGKRFAAVAFLDGGQLYQRTPGENWPTIKADRLDEYRYGAGTGLRLLTPVGPVRLEWGYKLNPPEGIHGFWDRSAIHFSLGEVF